MVVRKECEVLKKVQIQNSKKGQKRGKKGLFFRKKMKKTEKRIDKKLRFRKQKKEVSRERIEFF